MGQSKQSLKRGAILLGLFALLFVNIFVVLARVQSFDYDPDSTVGIGVTVEVEYGCKKDPEVKKTEITGVNQVGFIVSSEYKVNAYVDSFKKIECELEDCEKGVKYEITVKYFIYLKAGIGFGLGWGTGTLGWTSKPVIETETFTTECICCD
jgi:hypothetical protein